MVVMLKQSCCGCTLKTGSLIIAVVFAILSFLHILMFSFAAADAAENLHYLRLSLEMDTEDAENSTASTTEASLHNSTYEYDSMAQHYEDIKSRIKMITLVLCICILVVLVECAILMINIILMFAANKDNARLVFAWVVGFGALSSCFLILQLIMSGIIFYGSTSIAGVIFFIVILTETAGAAYSTLVGYSYQRQLVGTAVARRISQQVD